MNAQLNLKLAHAIIEHPDYIVNVFESNRKAENIQHAGVLFEVNIDHQNKQIRCYTYC